MASLSKISRSFADRPTWSRPFSHKPAQEKLDIDDFVEIASNLEKNALNIKEGDHNKTGNLDGEISGLPDLDFEEVKAENEDDDGNGDDDDSFSVVSDDGLTKNVETQRLCGSRKLLWAGTKTIPAAEKTKSTIGSITESVMITRKAQRKTIQPKKLSPDIFGFPVDSDVTTTGNQLNHHVSGPSPVKESNGRQTSAQNNKKAGRPKATVLKQKASTSGKNHKDAKLSSAGTTSAHPAAKSANEHKRRADCSGKVDGLHAEDWDIVGYPDEVMPYKLSDGLLPLEWDDLTKAVDSYMHGTY